MDGERASVGDARSPVADVVAGGTVAMSAVDVQEVDRVGDLVVGGVGEGADVTHPIAHPGGGEVGGERLVVEVGLGFEAGDLLRASVVAGMRIDRNDLDAGIGGGGEHDRRPSAETPDLDDPATCRAPRRRLVQSARA